MMRPRCLGGSSVLERLTLSRNADGCRRTGDTHEAVASRKGAHAGPSGTSGFPHHPQERCITCGSLYGEPHTLPLVEPRSRKSAQAPDDKGGSGPSFSAAPTALTSSSD